MRDTCVDELLHPALHVLDGAEDVAVQSELDLVDVALIGLRARLDGRNARAIAASRSRSMTVSFSTAMTIGSGSRSCSTAVSRTILAPLAISAGDSQPGTHPSPTLPVRRAAASGSSHRPIPRGPASAVAWGKISASLKAMKPPE